MITKKTNPDEIIAAFARLVNDRWHHGSKKNRPVEPLDARIFETIAKFSVSIGFEAVWLRLNPSTKRLEVFLTKRGPHESYAGQWHVPGSIFRVHEQPVDVLRRLSQREFCAKMNSDYCCHADFFYQEERGWFLSRVYLVHSQKEPTNAGKWWPIARLPKILWLIIAPK